MQRVCVLAIVLILVTGVGWGAHAAAPLDAWVLTGRVLGPERADGVESVAVSLRQDGEEVDTAVTDANGEYQIGPVGAPGRPSSWELVFTPDRRKPTFYLQSSIPISIDEGTARVVAPDVVLGTGGCLKLSVAGPNGSPLADYPILVSIGRQVNEVVYLDSTGTAYFGLKAGYPVSALIMSRITFERTSLSTFTPSSGVLDSREVWIESAPASEDLCGKDLSRGTADRNLLMAATFDTLTRWPPGMPDEFSPARVLEWGRNPGLGVRMLHGKGHTGKGVSIAYVDGPLLKAHPAFQGGDIRYAVVMPDAPYMSLPTVHASMVASILLGKDTGIAPECTLYYFAHPAWIRNQKTHAEAIYRIMELNQSLPPAERIRIVGFSDGPDSKESNIGAFTSAITQAESAGIMVFCVESFPLAGLTIVPYRDRDVPWSFDAERWTVRGTDTSPLYVPTSGLTAAGNEETPGGDHYVYFGVGGLSMAIPYVVGVVALGLQIDPSLTKEDAIRYLNESSYRYDDGGIINPEGFLRLVDERK